jgi:hypothetical protein
MYFNKISNTLVRWIERHYPVIAFRIGVLLHVLNFTLNCLNIDLVVYCLSIYMWIYEVLAVVNNLVKKIVICLSAVCSTLI